MLVVVDVGVTPGVLVVVGETVDVWVVVFVAVLVCVGV